MAISGICTAVTIAIWIFQIKKFVRYLKQTHHTNFKNAGILFVKIAVTIFWLFCYLWLLLGTIMSFYSFWGTEKTSIALSTRIFASIFSVIIHWGLWGAFKEKLLPYLKK
jgi:hypothetical protein